VKLADSSANTACAVDSGARRTPEAFQARRMPVDRLLRPRSSSGKSTKVPTHALGLWRLLSEKGGCSVLGREQSYMRKNQAGSPSWSD
jgi:hypothetical protein